MKILSLFDGMACGHIAFKENIAFALGTFFWCCGCYLI